MTFDLLKWFVLLGCYAICSGANVAYFAFSFRDLKKRIKRAAKEDVTEDESFLELPPFEKEIEKSPRSGNEYDNLFE